MISIVNASSSPSRYLLHQAHPHITRFHGQIRFGQEADAIQLYVRRNYMKNNIFRKEMHIETSPTPSRLVDFQ
jgi:hypothetical protein